jgi:PAS domain-containing protein
VSRQSTQREVQLLHPEDRAHHQKLVETALRRGRGWACEFRVIRPRDGEIALLAERAEPAVDPVTGKRLVSEITWDITRSRRLEEPLQASEERLRAIYDAYEPIGLLSPDGKVLEANCGLREFAGELHGNSRAIAGQPLWETAWFAHTPGAPEELRQAIERAAAGEFVRYDAPLRRLSGKVSSSITRCVP